MTNKKSTKRALMSSIVSLMLCFSMLLGTTYAWFTDTVTSATNIIAAGNLDIELYHENDKDARTPVDANTELFNEVKLWEPGAMAYEKFTIENKGSLALKYQFALNALNATVIDTVSFASMLKVAVVEDDDFVYSREDIENSTTLEWKSLESFVRTGTMTAGAENEVFGVIIWWKPSENDNLFNVEKDVSVEVGVVLTATQLENEEDGFGSDYDNGAFIPAAPEAIPNEGGSMTVTGSTESGVTVKVPATVVNNLPGTVTSLSVQASAPVVDATNKTVSFTTVELVDQYGKEVDIAATGGKVTVTLPVGDAFGNNEKVEIYHDGSFVTYATVSDGMISYEVSHFCEVSVKAAEKVELDNTIDSVKEFLAFADAVNAGNTYAGQTVVLGADLDLAGVTWTPIGNSSNIFKGIFDGNGKVIKNLSVLMAGESDVGLFGVTHDGEIKNVTVENAKIAGRLDVGVVSGTPYTSKYTNITVKGHVEVDGMAYVGAVGGKNAYANWTNITVNVDDTSYVNASSVENGTAYRTYVGGVVGFNGEGGHTFKDITTNIDVYGDVCDIGGAFGIAHYGNKFENVTVTGTVTGAEDSFEIGGIAGVWNNGGANVEFTNCMYKGESNVSVVGGAYSSTGTGLLIIDGKDAEGNWVVTDATSLKNALTQGGEVKLYEDVKAAESMTIAEGITVTIDLNGKTITGTMHKNDGAVLQNNGTLTITGGVIKSTAENGGSAIANNGTLTVNGTTLKGAPNANGSWPSYTVNNTGKMTVNNAKITSVHGGVASYGDGAVVTLNNCELDMSGIPGFTSHGFYTYNNGEIVVNGGTYANKATDQAASGASVINGAVTVNGGAFSGRIENYYGTPVIKGGTFSENPRFVAADYKATQVGDVYMVTAEDTNVVSNADALVEALEAGKNVVFANDIQIDPANMSNAYGKTGINVKNGQTIDGNDYTLDIKGAGGTWDSGINTTGGMIKNITVTGSFRGIFINHNSEHSEKVVLENVTLTGVTYTISCDQGLNQGIEATNCTFNGWTSFAKTAGEAKFVNCNFGEGNGYAYCRPYSNTEFVNCTFSDGYAVDTTKADVTFIDCANPSTNC